MATPIDYQEAHEYSDTDATTLSLHHTLGPSGTQAAPGNHNHDRNYSGIDHTHDGIYAPIDTEDVGSILQISDLAPTTRPDGNPLSVGDLWLAPDNIPALDWYQGIRLSGPNVDISLGSGVSAEVPGLPHIIFSAPCDGVLEVKSSAEFKPSTNTGYVSYAIGASGSFITIGGSSCLRPQPASSWSSFECFRHFRLVKGVSINLWANYFADVSGFVIQDVFMNLLWRPYATGNTELDWS